MPIDAVHVEHDHIIAEFKKALPETGIGVPTATRNLPGDHRIKDGVFTGNDPQMHASGLQETMCAVDLGAELDTKVYVSWSEREGIERDAGKDALDLCR